MPNLSDASNVYVGSQLASKVYLGSTEIWTGGGGGYSLVPAATFWNTFDAGGLGSPISTTDSGSGNAWTRTNGGSTSSYYGSDAKNGSKGVLLTAGVANNYLEWDTAAASQCAAGCWVKPDQLPSADSRIFDIRNTSSSGTVSGVLFNASEGRFRIMQGSSGLASPSQSPVMTLDAWYWVTLGLDAGAQEARLMVFDTNGARLHDSGVTSLTLAYSNFTTSRWIRPLAVDFGATAFDDTQWHIGSPVPLLPWVVEKPSALNTGHNPAALDGTLSGTQYMDTPDTLVENKTINGSVVVRADNVGFRNCVFTGGSSSNLLEFRNPGGFVEDSTFLPTDPTADVYNAIRGHHFEARRNDISKVCDAFSLHNPDTSGSLAALVEQNWVHELYYGPDPGQGDGISHNDGVQVHGPGGCTIRYNYFEMTACTSPASTHAQGTSGFIITDGIDNSPQPDIDIYGNWFAGSVGAWINIASDAAVTHVDLFRNWFDDTHPAHNVSFQVLANLSANLTVPGLPASTGQDTNNNNNLVSSGAGVTVTRFSP